MATRGRKSQRPEAILAEAELPVYLLDGKRKVVAFNEGCVRLTGVTAEQIVGQACDYVSTGRPKTVEGVLAALAPPPEVWTAEGGKAAGPVSVAVFVPHLTQPSQGRLLTCYPLGASAGMLCTLTPVPAPAAARPSLTQQLHAELAAARQALRQRTGEDAFLTHDPAVIRALAQVRLVATGDWPALFVGERGTGRQHLARILHAQSSAARRAFVPIDAFQLPEADFLTTLRKALDAALSQEGIPAFQPGMVLLENIDSLSSQAQASLRQVVQGPGVQAVRWAASTTTPLRELVRRGQFDNALAEWWSVLEISLPPLRDRPKDVLLLAQAFLEDANRGKSRQFSGFRPEALELIELYNWPGNVDELVATIRDAVAKSAGPQISAADLPFSFRAGMDAQRQPPTRKETIEPLDVLLERTEREQIERALREARNNKSRAADLLSIPRPRLYRRMEQLGIADPEPGDKQTD